MGSRNRPAVTGKSSGGLVCLCGVSSPAPRGSSSAPPVAATPGPPANSVAGSTNSSPTTEAPCSKVAGVKCKMCRPRPKFGFLRSQRSLDSGPGCASPARAAATVKEAEAARAALPRARRAHSAERYEGLRVHERAAATPLPRQTSPQTPVTTSLGAGHGTSPPPPSYELVVGQAGLPPSYDEYLRLRTGDKRATSPPPPWSHTNQAVATQTPARAPSPSPSHICKCDDCQTLLRQICRQRLPPAAPRPQLRVSLPPEVATPRECTCFRCQPRPSSYSDAANVDSAMLISMDTTTAMHGVMTDGIAFCSLM